MAGSMLGVGAVLTGGGMLLLASEQLQHGISATGKDMTAPEKYMTAPEDKVTLREGRDMTVSQHP